MSARLPAYIDRHNLVAVLRAMIAAAESTARERLHRRTASPAAIPLELWFDDEAEADLVTARLVNLASTGAAEQRPRLYTLSGRTIGCDTVPSWNDGACDPAAFHAILAAANLRAAHPFHPRLWLAFDDAMGIGVQLARSPTDRPVWFSGAPLRHHLHWLLRARGRRIAHAATLGRNGRGILLLGHGGAGKSGTTLAGLAARLQTVGDDYVALSGLDPAVAQPLFRIVKQDRAGLARIAGLAAQLADRPLNWMNKVEFNPATIFPGCFADALRIGAIVLPRLGQAVSPRFAPATPGEAMRVLMRTNLYQYPGEPDDGLAYYAALMRSLPVFHLDLCDRAIDNGSVLADLVADLG
jgi:hypothetical protein